MQNKTDKQRPHTVDVQAITDLAAHMARLREVATRLKQELATGDRGFFTPIEDDQVQSLWVSYHKSRAALHDLISTVRTRVGKPSGEHLSEFAIAYAAALILVDAARSLRALFNDDAIVRRKLNEASIGFGIEAGSFDAIQMSLTDPRNALAIREANQFYAQHRQAMAEAARANQGLQRVVAVIERLENVMQVSTSSYVKARVVDRQRDATDRILIGSIVNMVYSIQEWGSRLIGSINTVPSHVPRLPDHVQEHLRRRLLPGDVLATRKDNALTNYFLPGFWPHVAMYVGDDRVVESLKDGVRERTMDSPFGNDAVAVIRPQLDGNLIEKSIERARSHIGKPYDFDFDFTRSDRMVCTEVVYRSYEGLGGVGFDLVKRAGRQTLSAEDLLRLAMREQHFKLVTVYCKSFGDELLDEDAAQRVLLDTVERTTQ